MLLFMAQSVVVVGAGVIGLSIARALASRGCAVTILDAISDAKAASFAAGGILGVGSEASTDGPLYRLARAAFDRWPAAAERIAAESGRGLRVTLTGTLLVAGDPREAATLRETGAFHRATGLASTWQTGDEARRLEPRLAPDLLGALHVPEGRLDSRGLHAALLAACRRRGLDLVERRASRLVERGGRVTGVETEGGGRTEGDAVVLAVGAWTAGLSAASGLRLPVVPVKGQMVRLDAPDDFLGHVVKAGPRYLVPHLGRGLVVGTTAEEAGFSTDVDEAALLGIERAAAALVPTTAGLPRAEAWAGLRPRLPDFLPALGPVRSRPGLFVATGHFRNGVLLCELTGELLARAVLGDVDPCLGAFDPERFRGDGHAPRP